MQRAIPREILHDVNRKSVGETCSSLLNSSQTHTDHRYTMEGEEKGAVRAFSRLLSFQRAGVEIRKNYAALQCMA